MSGQDLRKNESSDFVGTPVKTAQMKCPQAECSRAWVHV